MKQIKFTENMKHLQSRGEIFLGRAGMYILYCQPRNVNTPALGSFEVQKNVRSTRDFGNVGSFSTEDRANFQYIYTFQKKKDAIGCIVEEEQKDFEANQRLIDYNKESRGSK